MNGNQRRSDQEMDGCDGFNDAARLHGNSENSGVTLDDDGIGNWEDFVRQEENVRQGLQMGESMSTKWTDEKHSLYLNSIEARFVKQLHSELMDLNGWVSRNQNLPKQNTQQASSSFSSGQFKVLRSGCWEKLNFGRDRSRVDGGDESRNLLGNCWIQHFRSCSASKKLEETSPLPKNENLISESIQLGRQKYGITSTGPATNSEELPTRNFGICHQDSVGSNTEVSDQNFVDEGCADGKRLSSSCRKKRVRAAVDDVSSKDQVVPLGKSPLRENKTSWNRREEDCRVGQSQNAATSACMKSRPPILESQ